jgi:ferredoxin-NADP reductase
MTVTESAPLSPRRLEWQVARVRNILAESSRVKSLQLDVEGWQGHLPGQHVDIRLTSEDGYQAERTYSIASPPEENFLTITVERVENGEVSPYLVDDLRIGDQFEIRGPIGGYFVWTVATRGPLCLLAGGSGIAPLMAMLRHRDRRKSRIPAALLYSSRTLGDIIYRKEFDAMTRRDSALRIVNTLTRAQAEGWSGRRGRIDKALIAETCFPPQDDPSIFVCGPTSFVEDVSRDLVELNYASHTIKTERFGPSGGETS